MRAAAALFPGSIPSPPLQIFGLQEDDLGRSAYLQIVNPCGGLFEGDTAELDVRVEDGVSLYLTTQAATKIYPSEHGVVSRQGTRFHVTPGGILEYCPLPLIPFARARFIQEMTIVVEPGGICLVAEVLAPGRLARGERFAYDMVRSCVEGWIGVQPVVFEQMILEPRRGLLTGVGLLDHGIYLGTLYVLTTQSLDAWVSRWNRQLAEDYSERVGVTPLAYGGLVVRILGQTGQEVLRRLDSLRNIIRREGLGLPTLQVYRPFA